MNSHVAKCAGTFIQMTAKMWTVSLESCANFLSTSFSPGKAAHEKSHSAEQGEQSPSKPNRNGW